MQLPPGFLVLQLQQVETHETESTEGAEKVSDSHEG